MKLKNYSRCPPFQEDRAALKHFKIRSSLISGWSRLSVYQQFNRQRQCSCKTITSDYSYKAQRIKKITLRQRMKIMTNNKASSHKLRKLMTQVKIIQEIASIQSILEVGVALVRLLRTQPSTFKVPLSLTSRCIRRRWLMQLGCRRCRGPNSNSWSGCSRFSNA